MLFCYEGDTNASNYLNTLTKILFTLRIINIYFIKIRINIFKFEYYLGSFYLLVNI